MLETLSLRRGCATKEMFLNHLYANMLEVKNNRCVHVQAAQSWRQLWPKTTSLPVAGRGYVLRHPTEEAVKICPLRFALTSGN